MFDLVLRAVVDVTLSFSYLQSICKLHVTLHVFFGAERPEESAVL